MAAGVWRHSTCFRVWLPILRVDLAATRFSVVAFFTTSGSGFRLPYSGSLRGGSFATCRLFGGGGLAAARQRWWLGGTLIWG